MAIKICACGACGRMCGLVTKNLIENGDFELVGAVDAPQCEEKGKDIGDVLKTEQTSVKVKGADELDSVLSENNVDVMVDFTNAKASLENVKTAANNKVNVVVGTTGFSDEQMQEMKETIKENNISGVIYPNMAVGVNILFKLIKQAAKAMKDYDIEITEAHHNNKLDSPSGTAGKIGEIISSETGKDIKYGRGQQKEERGNEIRIHAIRGGDIPGEHDVMFAGPGERIDLIHRAISRQPFVNGTMKAIQFVHNKKDGKVYGMDDVLGLK